MDDRGLDQTGLRAGVKILTLALLVVITLQKHTLQFLVSFYVNQTLSL